MIHDGSGADQDGLDAGAFDEALAAGSPERDFGRALGRRPASSSTPAAPPGMPKGVMWRSEDIFFALAGRHRLLHPREGARRVPPRRERPRPPRASSSS